MAPRNEADAVIRIRPINLYFLEIMTTTIFERMKAGELIRLDDSEYPQIDQAIHRAFRITGELNTAYHDQDRTREVLSDLFGERIDPSTAVMLPFYTDFGQFTRMGKNVFVNMGCTFMDRGGISIGDGALIGPGVKLITENHPPEPHLRRGVRSSPIVIGPGAWLGAGATVLPGVSIGANSIVGAGAVVTSDVPANPIVVGVPARIVKKIESGVPEPLDEK